MTITIQSPRVYLWMLAAVSLLVPRQSRRDWRREWEAEIVSRWLLLQEWGKLDPKSKLDLFKKVQGSIMDVLSFQQRRVRLLLVALNILAALLLGFGALQEFIIRGLRDRQLQPFFLSLMAIIVSLLFVTSAVALLRRWSAVRRLIILTSILSILVHIYGALPPHRNMGFLALIVGAGYGLLMLIVFEWNGGRKTSV